MIRVENVSKTFSLSRQQAKELNTKARSVTAVDDISFACKPGRIFSLLGPNGAGKTTTLRMIATILKPTAGTIHVNGYDVVREDDKVRASIGFLTGSTGLYHRLTPNELVNYFAKLYKLEQRVSRKRKEELFELLDMNDFANKRIGQLSTGMKQKVSIVRTMIHDPDIVVFDEPTSGLDVITAENIIQLIRRCRDDNKTVIFSSHIMSEVDLLCDDLAIIHEGKLIYESTMEDFRQTHQGVSLTEAFIETVNAV
ncbi:MAG: ATP-binding cassette domain-containing protein [Bacteroidetes bacterium]|nr:ATP-binding cassette domain-containing protein [Bacteroidota bacterium]